MDLTNLVRTNSMERRPIPKEVIDIIENELSAIKIYKKLGERFDTIPYYSELEDILEDHFNVAKLLKTNFIFYGNEPIINNKNWDLLKEKNHQGDLFDIKTIELLIQGEKQNLETLEKALHDPTVDNDIKYIIQTKVLPRQQKHLEILYYIEDKLN